MEQGEQPGFYDSLRIPEFRHMLIARFTFVMGTRMLATLMFWWIYELTHSKLLLGCIGLAEVVPALLLALYAGHIIDKSEKRKLVLRCTFLYFLAAVLLASLSVGIVEKSLGTALIVSLIYIIIFCSGIIRSFVSPIYGVMLGYIVPKKQIVNAATWNQFTFLFAAVAGHACCGFLIAFFKEEGPLITVSALFFTSFLLLLKLKPKPVVIDEKKKAEEAISTWTSVKQGLAFVYKTKELIGAMTMDMFAVLFGGAVAMVPVFAKDILHISNIAYGWLNAANDIGAILIIGILTLFPLRRKQGKLLLIVVIGFGLCIITFGLSKIFLLSFLALLIGGMLDGISALIRSTILQLKTPDHMRGRVMSVNSMFINSSNELGQFESGFAASIMGTVPSVVFGGCMTILVAVITWFKAPSLRKMEY